MSDPTMSDADLVSITGYQRPAEQLQELLRQGFYRARRSPTSGRVILERVHYDAVCAGSKPANEPRVHAPRLRRVV